MLVVRVEVWPGGDADRASEIARVGIANTTGTAEDANYDVVALMNRDVDEQVVRSEVLAHRRSAGWLPLVRRVLTNLLLPDLRQEASYDDPIAKHLRKGEHV
jgi:hypothetical protein